MRVAFLVPHLKLSGGMRIILGYAERLAERNHDVRVYVEERRFIRRAWKWFSFRKPSWIDIPHVKILHVPSFVQRHIHPADAVIATNYENARALMLFPEGDGKPFYLVQHDEGLYHGSRELVDEALRSRTRKIVVSTWLQDMMKDTFGQESDLLLNPIDTMQFRQVLRTSDPTTVRILLLHHTYEWKGTAEGVAAVEAVRKRHPEVRLILFGIRKKEDLGISYDEYHYAVPQEKLAELYSNADIYLCPSWDEGFGLPSTEAMACGAALVTYDNGGSRDYAFHEKTALVACRRDTVDLETQLERMVIDMPLRQRIAAAGMQYVRALPGWDTRTDELERILGT